MTTLIVTTSAQVTIQMLVGGRAVDHVIGISFSSMRDAMADLNTIKNAWEATGGPLKIRSTNLKMVGYRLVDLTTVDGTVAFLPSTATGAAAAAMGVISASALVTYGNSTRNRSQRGRLYHGPLAISDVNTDGRTLTTAATTAITAAYGGFRDALTAGQITWQVISRKNSSKSDVGAIGVSTVLATQRRRMRS